MGLAVGLVGSIVAATPAAAQITQFVFPINNGTACPNPSWVQQACSTNIAAAPLPTGVWITNPSDAQTGLPTGQNISVTGSTITGGPAAINLVSPSEFAVLYLGTGLQNVQLQNPNPGNNGPTLGLTNNATFTVNSLQAGVQSAVVAVESAGGAGLTGGEKNQNDQSWYVGGSGGTVTLVNAGSITLNGASAPQPGFAYPVGIVAAMSAFAPGGPGGSYDTHNDCCGGFGGNGGQVTLNTQQGSTITLGSAMAGQYSAGLLAVSAGGAPGNQTIAGNQYPGNAGSGGPVSVTHDGTISSIAVNSFGIVAASRGGDGPVFGGQPTMSGGGGSVQVMVNGTGANSNATPQITMTGSNAIGVLALSAAGESSYGFTSLTSAGGNVDVNIGAGSRVALTGGGQYGIGVLAISSGTALLFNPFNASNVNASGGGFSGTVTVKNQGLISTSGDTAIGIAAISTGGSGIVANASGSGLNYLGNSGQPYGSASGAVVVDNSGAISSDGSNSHGIAAISTGGGGLVRSLITPAGIGVAVSGTNPQGIAWSSGAAVGGNTGAADTTGHVGGLVTVANSGSIATGGGTVAMGIVAQSIGGGGGSASGPQPALFVGDAGGAGGSGGAVEVTSSGQIETYGKGALGILAQSVGGGGGNGANAVGLFVAVGGSGGSGGDGAATTVGLSGTGAVTTSGDYAAAVLAQSVGGGGGHGGFADSFGLFVTTAIGGTGGSGGDGGGVQVGNAAAIRTSGNQGQGLVAQSIGGGGGHGGAAVGDAVGIGFSASIALGGTGGNGGSAGPVTVANTGTIQTGCVVVSGACSYSNPAGPTINGADSVGILAQAIGGGGGHGGLASAKSLTLPGDDIPTFSFDFAMGGNGGGAGNGYGAPPAKITGPDGKVIDLSGLSFTTPGGQTVTLNGQSFVLASNGGTITTGGDGSHGILAQSIGGGGGHGADSTASAYAIEGAMPTFKLSVAVGGQAGSGGNGGAVYVDNGTTAAPGIIATYGQNAVGMAAQSIGGGGGAGGNGNASAGSPNLGDDTGKSLTATIGVGGNGGNGGSGGTVGVINTAGSRIATIGSGSHGILAQSIGNGGGTAGGGSSAGSGDTFDMNVAVGGAGGGGGGGGAVTAVNAGTISTGGVVQILHGVRFATGGDAVGILAQSIGGGGGTGGTSDASASISALDQAEDALNDPSNSYSANVSVGGKGGAAGSGGAVAVTNAGGSVVNGSWTAGISTIGNRAYGILAQSIGGGGGSGGAATSSSTSVLAAPSAADKSNTYSASVSVGGGGGSGGDGSSVSVTNTGVVTTAGYAAHGALAQSIGGGGGVGAEGTVNNTTTLGLGASGSEASGNGGSGGTVTFNGTSTTLPGVGSIVTAGDDAYGVLAQSIGGGGGMVSAGCTNSAPKASLQGFSQTLCLGNGSVTGSASPWTDASDFSFNIGGTNGASGNGGTVNITQPGGQIVTVGARAMGLVAQSIGGGGGLGAAANANVVSVVFNSGQASGTGGGVNVTLGPSSGAAAGAITTAGAGAFGIFAQSIGGGGGFVGDSSLAFVIPNSNSVQLYGVGADGGAVSITSNGTITTTGANAHGIFAQSLGGAGLLFGSNDRLAMNGGVGYGAGGSVTIMQNGGTIAATGRGSIGIFAQSSGSLVPAASANIAITVDGAVIGGTNGGTDVPAGLMGAAGIAVSGGGSAANGNPNSITIGSSGSVSSTDGTAGLAIFANDGVTNVINNGTITGSVNVGNSPLTGTGATDLAAAPPTSLASTPRSAGTVLNNGTFNTGSAVIATSLTNTGLLAVGGAGPIGATQVSGSFVQTAGGRLVIDLDSLAGRNDLLSVSGSAAVTGRVEPAAVNLLPGAPLTILSAGQLAASAVGRNTAVVDWQLRQAGNSLTIQPSADFTPAGLPLGRNDTALAQHLQNAWNAGGSAALAPLFGYLGGFADAAGYGRQLEAMSPQALQTFALQRQVASRMSLDSSLSCPTFVAGGTELGETSCVWGRVAGLRSQQFADKTGDGYRVDGQDYRVGAQGELGHGWFAGANIGYQTTDGGTRQSASGDGQAVDGSIALKRIVGPWHFAAAFSFGYGTYDNARLVPYRSGTTVQTSTSDVLTVSGRLRAAYEFAFDGWYAKPYVDLDVLHTRMPGFREAGLAALAMAVDDQVHTTVALSPMVEIGARIDLGGNLILRPYLNAGASFLSNDTWSLAARLEGAPLAAGDFATRSRTPGTLANLEAGLQLFQAEGWEARLQYGLQAGRDYLSQIGSARIAYRF